MTTYVDKGPYVPEPDFPSWLAKQGFPETYDSIFDWSNVKIQQEYDSVFNTWDEAEYIISCGNSNLSSIYHRD
mgnify:CR=1 FL=1